MKRNRLVFYGIFGAWHLIVFFVTLYVRSKQADLGSLYNMLHWIPVFIYGSLFGVLLLIADVIWNWREGRSHENIEEAMLLENNTLKAKIYDLQEGKKEKQFIPPPSK